MRLCKGLLLLVTVLLAACGDETFTSIRWDASSLREAVDPPGDFYAYAPTAIEDGTAQHIYTCHNSEDGIIRDSVFYAKRVNGKIAENKEVLRHGEPGSWDSQNVCDTSVVGGKFHYDGVAYEYAMFYLGNNLPCSCNNQIGVAFANDLSADSWTKYPEPIVKYPLDDVSWGVGQQSAVSLDGNGKMMLFYMRKDITNTLSLMKVEVDLGDMARYTVGEPLEMTNEGLTGTGGLPNVADNADIVYDRSRDRFYAVTEMQPYPSDNPDYISEAEQVVSIPAAYVRGGGGAWRSEGTIDAGLTGFKRNHNAGIVRTIRGELPDTGKIKVMFTTSCAGAECASLPEWTYEVWEIEGKLPKVPS
ncbi:hypothetical protein [Cohnella nanjingensis]|uniref:Uncharacterized protein n=1 Tax=Cohnella nanjingensis TaxID=1387779 RepID=A0A7X0RU91_9BACL|nr:hypothetical protein [Cohnella nanjingensis]MBB6672525.1 hypothetical protein [Cohnella nanjingensis]